jgi:branched-subunit amino acid aminotransferase/4-amino-4-deoxychorismate lyase
MLVERVRTFGGRLPPLELHWDRLSRGVAALRIRLPFEIPFLEMELKRLLALNADWLHDQQDLSLVVAISPGNTAWGLGGFACMIHCMPLPWNRLRTWYVRGCELVSSRIAAGAGECWPGDIKTRSRLNYFLADRDAKDLGEFPLALLSTSHGTVADTSVANLLLITRDGVWVSPKREEILAGTSLQIVEEILADEGIAIDFRSVAWDELAQAREVLLVGNSGCAWHASSIDEHRIGTGLPGAGCRLLQQRWIERAGWDWLSQALDSRRGN